MNINNHAFAIVRLVNELTGLLNLLHQIRAISPTAKFADSAYSIGITDCKLVFSFPWIWCNECFHSFLNPSKMAWKKLLFCRLIKNAYFNTRFLLIRFSLVTEAAHDHGSSTVSEKSHLINERNAKIYSLKLNR